MTLAPLAADLAAEHDALDATVAPLAADEWDAPTPAPGWAVRHQIAHLTYFDEQAALAATDEAAFSANRDALLADASTIGDGGPHASLPAGELLARWREGRAALLAAFGDLDPRARLPWYGPPMSARSFLTARLMETWAHGVDIAQGLGVPLSATDRLRHVAHLGIVTRGWSYAVRGGEAPDEDVRVELEPPGGGEPWVWGDEASPSRVTGPALDFCLVVTQRLAVGDSALVAEGDAATEWLEVAQAFAGGPTATTRR